MESRISTYYVMNYAGQREGKERGERGERRKGEICSVLGECEDMHTCRFPVPFILCVL